MQENLGVYSCRETGLREVGVEVEPRFQLGQLGRTLKILILLHTVI